MVGDNPTQHSGLSTQDSGSGTRHSSGTVLGFDFGLKRIGVAVGDLSLGMAHPLETIAAEESGRRFEAIAALVREWQPVRLVVGLPSYLDGTEHDMSARCRRFARQLEGRFNLPATLVDERLSSVEASRGLNEAGITGRRQKPYLDQAAAQTILQTFFDGQRHATA